MLATHVIVRPVPGMPYQVGDEVDASSWRRPERLEVRRYIRRIGAEDRAVRLPPVEEAPVSPVPKARKRR